MKEKGCPFCGSKIELEATGMGIAFNITCLRCGTFHIPYSIFITIDKSKYERRQQTNASSWLHENQTYAIKDHEDIKRLFSIKTPSFHERADKMLSVIEKMTIYAGQPISYEKSWESLSWSLREQELSEILTYLQSTAKRIECLNTQAPLDKRQFKITPEGWQHLEKLKQVNVNSRQAFVAMWFDPEMNEVYENAIRPAIEFIEEGEQAPRFKAVKIDNVEHVNDINDEIIAQIRRSRFMVCDLTGYRGGVYFEAGFAYGLGVNVIYTCRKDWIKDELFKNEQGMVVESLCDSAGNKIKVKKEGVHFDLAHRNRIEWSPDQLDDFKVKLQNRIKAVIP